MKTILSYRRDRCLAMFTIFLVIVALIAGIVGCSGGEEEEEEEEEIATWFELDNIRNDLGGAYLLTNNLDEGTEGWEQLASPTANEGQGWEPIGTRGSVLTRFTGTFDGQGYTISNLSVNRPELDDVGLFGAIDERAVIKNVGLVGVNVTGHDQVGALVGYNWKGNVQSDIEPPYNYAYSTYSTGIVTGNDKVGGLVGENWGGGVVDFCESYADVYHVSNQSCSAGGLVGKNSGHVTHCRYQGNVTGGDEVGGLVGFNAGIVRECKSTHNVTGSGPKVGGAAAVNDLLADLSGVSATGYVNGKWREEYFPISTDGTVGDAQPSDNTSANVSYVGALVGCNRGFIDNCSAAGSVRGYQYVGGFVGCNDPDGVIGASFAAAKVDGSPGFVGAFAGKNDGSVANSFWDREVSETTYGIGQGDSTGIIGLSSQDMKNINTYEDAGWDICPVAAGEVNPECEWNIEPGGYPFLSGKQLAEYNLTISSTTGGEVTSPGEGPFTYYEGRVVNLVAEADEGYQFVNWTGDVGAIADVEDATTTVTMSSDCSVKANFEEGASPVAVRDWYDLDAVRDNLAASYILINDLDSTTAGYAELASPTTANGGKGWDPIDSFWGSFDGNGHKIEDLFINRPDEWSVGLFGSVDAADGRAVIKNVGLAYLGVTGFQTVGGLVGFLGNCTVSDCYSTGDVAGELAVGGLVGWNGEGTVSNSYSTGSVTGDWDVGGLVGANGGVAGSDAGTVSNSYSTANVVGGTRVGGLIGSSRWRVTNSYSTGSVTGDEWAGGLVGSNRGAVRNCYSTGNVAGPGYSGGLMGWNEGGTVSNSFWDIQASGQTASAGGTGKTTTEMHDMATFVAAGWDICAVARGEFNTASTWNIVPGEGYPFLS
jgi:hypothetical protein